MITDVSTVLLDSIAMVFLWPLSQQFVCGALQALKKIVTIKEHDTELPFLPIILVESIKIETTTPYVAMLLNNG